jgi:ketosteroid isomerase-like protein
MPPATHPIYVAWERGDYSSVEWAHPDIEFELADGPTPGHWTGLAGMAEGARGWMSAWDEWRIKVDEYRVVDDERVLVLSHVSGRGKTSGLELGQMQTLGTSVVHVRDGNVTRLVFYADRGRAFADLGLAPEGDLP